MINEVGVHFLNSGFETCLALNTRRCWGQNISQIAMFGANLTKGSGVIRCIKVWFTGFCWRCQLRPSEEKKWMPRGVLCRMTWYLCPRVHSQCQTTLWHPVYGWHQSSHSARAHTSCPYPGHGHARVPCEQDRCVGMGLATRCACIVECSASGWNNTRARTKSSPRCLRSRKKGLPGVGRHQSRPVFPAPL